MVTHVQSWFKKLTIVIPNGIKEGFRWNFRWIANVRITLLIGTILLSMAVFCILYCIAYGFQLFCLPDCTPFIYHDRAVSTVVTSCTLIIAGYWYCGVGKVLYNGRFSSMYRH